MTPTPAGPRRLAVLATGEAARRVLCAAQDRNAAAGRLEVRTMVVLTTMDRLTAVDRGPAVREADEVTRIAPAGASDPFDPERLAAALHARETDLVWLGDGTLGDRAQLAEACERLGMVVVGARAAVMSRLGDARQLSWLAGRIGLPLCLPDPGHRDGSACRLRRVDVAVAWDTAGAMRTLGPIEVIVQLGGRPVLTESPGSALSTECTVAVLRCAASLIGHVGDAGVATVRFSVDTCHRSVALDGVDVGLFPTVVEATVGVDLVELALHLALGGVIDERISGEVGGTGHAIEAVLLAGDPDPAHAAAARRVLHLSLPTGPGVRVDTGTAPGDLVPDDPGGAVLARITCWGQDRNEARARALRALRQTRVLIEDRATVGPFLLEVLAGPAGASQEQNVALHSVLGPRGSPSIDVVLLAAAVETHERLALRDRMQLFRTGAARCATAGDVWQRVDLRVCDECYRLQVAALRPDRYRVRLGEHRVDVEVQRRGPHERRLLVGNRSFDVLVAGCGPSQIVDVEGAVYRVGAGDTAEAQSPGPAMVMNLPVAVGDEVAQGAVVAVLESMKLEATVRAPVAGQVIEVLVEPGTAVEAGRTLVRIDPCPVGAPFEPSMGANLVEVAALFSTSDRTRPGATCGRAALDDLRWLVMGYDFDLPAAEALLADVRSARAAAPGDQGLLGPFPIL